MNLFCLIGIHKFSHKIDIGRDNMISSPQSIVGYWYSDVKSICSSCNKAVDYQSKHEPLIEVLTK